MNKTKNTKPAAAAAAAAAARRQPPTINRYPRGWNRKSINELAWHYENQSDNDAAAELEAAFNDPHQTLMLVPRELVPKVEQLLATHRAKRSRRAG